MSTPAAWPMRTPARARVRICGQGHRRAGGGGERLRLHVPEITAIDDETLDRFFREEPALETYRRNLEQLRRMKAHILSPAEEQLLAAAGEMANAPDAVASVFRNADLTFPDVTDAQGKVHRLTNGSFVPLLESPDADFRKRVFDAYYDRLGEFKNTVAATLDAQFKQLRFFAEARRFPNTLEASLYGHEVPARCTKTSSTPCTPTWTRCTAMSPCAKSCWARTSCTCPTSMCPSWPTPPGRSPLSRPRRPCWRPWACWARTTRRFCARALTTAGSTFMKTPASAAAPIPPARPGPTPMCS